MPLSPTPQPDALQDFLAAPESCQLAFVEALPHAELLSLHNRYIRWSEDEQDGPLSLRVLARMLERLEPNEYLEHAQDADLRESLSPPGLAQLRAESYEMAVGPLLLAPPEIRESFLRGLDLDELRSLDTLLQRYSRERGRSPAWRETHAALTDRLSNLEHS